MQSDETSSDLANNSQSSLPLSVDHTPENGSTGLTSLASLIKVSVENIVTSRVSTLEAELQDLKEQVAALKAHDEERSTTLETLSSILEPSLPSENAESTLEVTTGATTPASGAATPVATEKAPALGLESGESTWKWYNYCSEDNFRAEVLNAFMAHENQYFKRRPHFLEVIDRIRARTIVQNFSGRLNKWGEYRIQTAFEPPWQSYEEFKQEALHVAEKLQPEVNPNDGYLIMLKQTGLFLDFAAEFECLLRYVTPALKKDEFLVPLFRSKLAESMYEASLQHPFNSWKELRNWAYGEVLAMEQLNARRSKNVWLRH